MTRIAKDIDDLRCLCLIANGNAVIIEVELFLFGLLHCFNRRSDPQVPPFCGALPGRKIY